MLKSLEVTGFKSFAKKTELFFKSNVTAIVGPNGSGKSNVAEAFRFVLGEQSIKSMRGKRGEDLIWNGSSEIGRANRAKVKIVLENNKKLFSTLERDSARGGSASGGFEEVVIERVVNRDGNNEYYLNGSSVRLKDIIALLAEAHIGALGQHIISQGEADRILSANMRERKEIMEDALGLKIYQYKREESERKLQKTEENIKQVESLRREIAPHIRFLKKQVEKIEKTEELRVELAKFYRQYLKQEKNYLENQKSQIKSEKEPISQKLENLEKQMNEAKDILEASSKKDKKSEELIEIENKIEKERFEKDEFYLKIGRIEGEISAGKRNIEKLEAEQNKEGSKTISLYEVEELEREISAFSEISRIIEKIREFIQRHKNNFNNKNLEELRFYQEKLGKQKQEMEIKIQEMENELKDLENKYNFIKNSIEEDKDSERVAEKNIFRISSEQSESRNKLELLKEREHRLEIEETDWKREIEEGEVLLGSAIVGFENELAFAEGFNEAREENRRELEKMKIRLEELGGADGTEVTKEYKETLERDEYLKKELEDLKKSADSLKELIKELLEKLNTEFKQGIEKINNTFQEFFGLMFDGGHAELKIEKLKIKNLAENEFGEIIIEKEQKTEIGIDIDVSLPRKRIKGLDMLSGGERALTSIALIFAISRVNPPPFIILDETDAALDEANSKKYGNMIESLSKVSQLILITHNRETMSRASVIYGVTMGRDSISSLLSIDFEEAVSVAK
ncbi:MAG: AAA family ATPase [Candidatus Zambryskibacteria bacterium]|nr:AAA family ATPase [Candidatus Zambryskibacteria bacterium]